MRAQEIIWEIFFCCFSSLIQIFCVKRPNGVLGCPNDDLVCPDGISSCPDDTVDLSKRSFFLSGRQCFCDLYVALRPDVT
jgi:hypothetical protein